MIQKRVHKLRAKAFYDYIQENPQNAVSLCFEMQQVQALPKTPIQDSFCVRQVSLYNLCIVPLDSRDPKFTCGMKLSLAEDRQR